MRQRMTRERAETIGLDGLTFLAGLPEQMERFLSLSGLDIPALRARASDPDFPGFHPVLGLPDVVAVGVEKFVEKLHVQLVVFHDQDRLGLGIHFPILHSPRTFAAV